MEQPCDSIDWERFEPKRIFFASDLHVEMHPWQPPTGAGADDLLLIAGDIHTKARAGAWADKLAIPTAFIAGNHDHYGEAIGSSCRKIAASSGRAVFLERTELRMRGLRILGTTFWTDYRIDGDAVLGAAVCEANLRDPYAAGMSDHRKIKNNSFGKIRAADLAAEHAKSFAWLRQALAEPFDGETIVATHHAPSRKGLADPNRESRFDPAYASSHDDFAAASGASYWIHGHAHKAASYAMGPCQGLCNPRGYPGEDTGYNAGAHLIFSNGKLGGPIDFKSWSDSSRAGTEGGSEA